MSEKCPSRAAAVAALESATSVNREKNKGGRRESHEREKGAEAAKTISAKEQSSEFTLTKF